MNILVVTGRLAEASVKKAVSDSADVLVLPIAVAALITPLKLISGVKSSAFSNKKYDAVLVSGFSKFNFSKAEEEIGCPIFLGPKHAADLKYVLAAGNFSKTIPACEFIQIEKTKQARDMLDLYHEGEAPAFQIGTVFVGGTSRMKVLAEILAAETLSLSELDSQISFLISEGADMIDLGFSPDADSQKVSEVTAYAKSVCPIPVSIDSSDFCQISAGIAAGSDLILSADSRILAALKELRSSDSNFSRMTEEVAFVLIPDLFSKDDKLTSLEKNIADAQALGIKKILADPILSPLGKDFVASLNDYLVFHRRNPKIPILFGAGNVTELIDADSVGANALLTAAAAECGASVIFTPNASDKCRGSIRELKTASEMMVLSEIRESTPKDLGIDLLLLKEKRRRPEFNLSLISDSGAFHSLHLRSDEIDTDFSLTPPSAFCEKKSLVLAGSLHPTFLPETKWGWKPDKSGNFLIGLIPLSELFGFLTTEVAGQTDPALLKDAADELLVLNQALKTLDTPEKRVILAVHQTKIIIGTDSAFMLETILNENLISELSHAGYLGRELQKAEIALRLGRSYSQDDVF